MKLLRYSEISRLSSGKHERNQPFGNRKTGNGLTRARPAAAPRAEAEARAEETPDAATAVPALLLLLAIAAGRGEAGGDEPGAERRRHGRRHCSRPGSRERYEGAGQLIFGGGGGDAVASTGPKNRGAEPRDASGGRAGERSRGG